MGRKQLEHLDPISSLLPGRLWRLMGMNPGPFTLQGTNTYLVVLPLSKQGWLFDVGPPDSREYLANLQGLIKKLDCRLSRIFITHGHLDHVGGLAGLLKQFGNVQVWQAGEQIAWEEEDVRVTAVPTPGHTADHYAFSIKISSDCFLLTGDAVLGQEYSSIFEDYSQYMAGLVRMRDLVSIEPACLLPGHGPAIPAVDSLARINRLIEHRIGRHEEILALLALHGHEGLTAEDLVNRLYRSSEEPVRWAALRVVRLHLQAMLKEGAAQCGDDERWRPIKSKL